MKLSDFVVKFVERRVDSIFMLSGGGIMHLVDSVGNSRLKAYCCHHEQAAAIAAEGYARMKNNLGVVLVTTGPGGTNAITGVAGAWLDSIPLLVISGQVKTDNIAPKIGDKQTVRQMGFQELNVVDMVKPIVKYVKTVMDKDKIRQILEEAVYWATEGRPGPVWVEIPLDLQASDIDETSLESFEVPEKSQIDNKLPMKEVAIILKNAKRPLMMVGNGIRLSGGVGVLKKVLDKFHFNTVTSIFTADDLVTEDYQNYLGRQGMPGNELANYAIDNCDVLLIVGERMQLTQTSYDYNNFCSQAKIIMVDIDNNELNKKTLKVDLPICGDAKHFLNQMLELDFEIVKWEVKRDGHDVEEFDSNSDFVNVYRCFEEIGKYSSKYPVVTANGMASLAAHQWLKIRNGQRFLTNAGLGHMGSGLPMAVGASVAEGKKTAICFEGDGSLMLNIQELQTVIYHNLPIKLFIFNNNGYFSIRSTHLNYFKKSFASDSDNGLSLPDYKKLIKGWGLKYFRVNRNNDITNIKKVFSTSGPVVCELMIDPFQKMLPKWTAGQLREVK